jgi:hypothetical protein
MFSSAVSYPLTTSRRGKLIKKTEVASPFRRTKSLVATEKPEKQLSIRMEA